MILSFPSPSVLPECAALARSVLAGRIGAEIGMYRSPNFLPLCWALEESHPLFYSVSTKRYRKRYTKRYMNHLCSTAGLLARLDEPEPFVDASCDLGEDSSGIGVLQFGRLLAGVAYMFAKGGERRR
jgi:hypothetical protein